MIKQSLYIICLVFFSLPVISQVPVITSVSPLTGNIGTNVTISGSNFSPVASQNTVYLGGINATVLSASNTSLSIAVPATAEYKPISVTANNLTGYSYHPFHVTFPGGASVFTANSFQILSSGIAPGNSITTADLNNDTMPDVIEAFGSVVKIYKNTSTNNQVGLAPAIDLAVSYPFLYSITTCDVDGDGRLDIVAAGESLTTANVISVHINTSTNNNISFAAGITINGAGGEIPVGLEATDLNDDGKPEIIVTNSQLNRISILKNTTSNGVVSFTAMSQVLTTGSTPFSLLCSDLDGDNKPEILSANINGSSISVFRNISAGGNIIFDAPQLLSTSSSPNKIVAGDIDGDGKSDLLTSNQSSDNISVLRNTSSPGTISFESKLPFAVGTEPFNIGVSDFNGDGKIDVAVTNNDTLASNKNTVCILKNTSTNASISFNSAVFYKVSTAPNKLVVTDLNGDGKADLIVTAQSNTVILKNNMGQLETALCNGGTTHFVFKSSAVNFQWQANTGTGFTNITDGLYYNGTNTDSLIVSGVPSSFYGYQYRCIADSDTSDVFILNFSNTWTGAISSAWENPGNWSCGSVPDLNTDVVIQGGTIVISTSTTIRSLNISTGANLTINPGVILTILH
jgi:hypothetical protein